MRMLRLYGRRDRGGGLDRGDKDTTTGTYPQW